MRVKKVVHKGVKYGTINYNICKFESKRSWKKLKLLVIDGNSVLNRAYYGIRLLSTKKGMFTNGIYGFLTMLQKIEADVKPDSVAIAFDVKAPTFRHKAYDGYKAQRKGMPEELAMQMPVLKELLTALGYKLLTAEGWEADDIIGTLAQACKDRKEKCVIATGDRDTFQLVGDGVTVRLLSTKQGRPEAVNYDEAAIMEKYGVTPKQLIDIKAIQGDSSDNIPGIKGIGEKGASDLIQRFGSLEYIYNNLDTIDVKDGIRKKLTESKDSAFMSYMLGTVRTDAPVETAPENFIVGEPDRQKVSSIMTELELFSLLEKMGFEKAEIIEEPDEAETFEIDSEIDEFSLMMEMADKEFVAVLLEMGEIPSLTMVFDNKICVVNDTVIIRSVLESETNGKIVYDAKALHKAAAELDITVKNIVFDVTLAAYLLNPNSSDYSCERICAEYGVSMPECAQEYKTTAVLMPIFKKLSILIEENKQTELLKEIEIPLAEVLASMEQTGIMVDAHALEVFGLQLAQQVKELEESICKQAGIAFNINSPKQLGDVLFNKLELRPCKKTKTGYSTSADVLEALRYEYPIVEDVLQYRHLAKLKSTYCDGLLKVISNDGRIHSTFNQTETRTGRISSTEPNLQNIPVRTEIGREFRRMFVAEDGKVLCDADYSQIELRVLAHMSDDEVMVRSFNNNVDIHSVTASQVFHVPIDIVTPQMRTSAKAVNFGIVYGIGPFSLGKDIGVTTSEASQYIKAYLNNYAGVRKFMDSMVEAAKENGYSETLFGRRRPLPEISASNGNIRAFGERVAKNMPIQGTAADIIKIAMVRVFNRLRDENMKSKLILQIHDELIVEAPFDEQEKASQILGEEMRNAVKLSVPLIADVNCGKTWYNAKG